MILFNHTTESDVNYVVWSKNNSYTRGIYTNSTEILKYKCSSSDPRLRELVWVVSCSNDGEQCNERQLSNEDLKRGKKAEGWTVDDVATNETVLKITPRARSLSRFRDNGGMKITCLQYLKGERFASRSAAYHIKGNFLHVHILALYVTITLYNVYITVSTN